MISVAVVGILAAVAVPTYRSFLATANMTMVTGNFEQAIQTAQLTFQKNETRLALGLVSVVPDNTGDWISLLNNTGALAPGGDKAFYDTAGNPKPPKEGNPITGAISVKWKKKNPPRLEIWRPSYLSLSKQRVQVLSDGTIKTKDFED